MMNRSWNEGPKERIENRLQEAQNNKQKAINNRVKELQRELGEERNQSKDMLELRREMEEFRNKMKSLYINIFQGSKELSIRKNDLIRQIKGNQSEEYQAY